jgi:predicted 2-oxoglutarate/Fe(II)-dependent dioxygenase YbiX
MILKNSNLSSQGHLLLDFPLNPLVLDWVKNQKWHELDNYFLEISLPNGILNNFLSEYIEFTNLEHIIAIRTAPDDEDGIWHDDGSRFLGFSLSLNLEPQTIEGGELLFKKKEEKESFIIKPLPIGKIVIFLTGVYGYEHKVNMVTQGQRIVIAGWCS